MPAFWEGVNNVATKKKRAKKRPIKAKKIHTKKPKRAKKRKVKKAIKRKVKKVAKRKKVRKTKARKAPERLARSEPRAPSAAPKRRAKSHKHNLHCIDRLGRPTAHCPHARA